MFPAGNQPANADDLPLLDGWGWGDYWTPQDWLTWHRANKTRYGLQVANEKFIQQWQQQTFGAAPLDARSFDSEFRQYAKDNGFFDALYYGIGALAKPIGVVTSDLPDAVSATGSALRTLLPALAVVTLIGAVVIYVFPQLLTRTTKA